MNKIQIMALGLLIFRLVSSIFILAVIRKQLILFKAIVPKQLNYFRKVLFIVSLTILFGNLVPIIIDSLALFISIGRAQPRPIGVAYAYSNALTSVISSIGWFIIYRMAESTDVINKKLLPKK